MSEKEKPLQRTDWAERYVEMLMSMPFISEFVFRSPQTFGKQQREITDLLIVQGETNIVFSQKCQQDPTSRSKEKNELWVCSKAKAGLSQLVGGLKTLTREAFWCEHPRRGRVQFSTPLAKIDEGIVLVETLLPVDLNSEADLLPLEHKGIPISYFSVNDFLNLVKELRTVPELLNYLRVRRSLCDADLRVVGDENFIYKLYLLNDRNLGDCTSRAAVRAAFAQQKGRLAEAIAFKQSNDRYCTLLEKVAAELSFRDANLPADLASLYEPETERNGYLKMQLAIADLELVDRIALGRAFDGLIQKMANSGRPGPDLVYGACHLDTKPDWVFVFGSSKKMDRGKLVTAVNQLTHGAAANYDKSFCLTVVDREGEGYDTAWLTTDRNFSKEQKMLANLLFAKLKMRSERLSLVPQN